MTKKEEFRCLQEADPDSGKRPDLSFALILQEPEVTAARREGRAAQQAYAAKMRCYDELASQNNLEFLPMIIESTGRIHLHLINFIFISEKAQGDIENSFLRY